jgi:hypothetical protein
MKKELFELIEEFIDAKIEYAIASRERDEEGYTGSCVDERKNVELIKEKIEKILNKK